MERLACLALLAATACSEWELNSTPDPDNLPAPNIVVEPPALQFAMLPTGEVEVQSFTISNDGEAPLDVSDIQVVSGLAFDILTAELDPLLEVGETVKIDVAFSPVSTNDFGQVLVFSDDPDSPEVPVDLSGQGAVPQLDISPSFHDFGPTAIPCGDEVEIFLNSVGAEDLTITDLDFLSGGLLTVDDDRLQAGLPLTLSPGQSTSLWVNLSAVDLGADTGTLSVTSNDPRGLVTADQVAEGFYSNTTTEQFLEPDVPPVDVMFLIDQSCSMEQDNVDDISNGIPGFINELQQVADWQLIQVTQETGCANGGVLDDTVPNADTLLINNAFNSFHHNYTEALLALAELALSKTSPGNCNAGFLRPGAALHIIVASDESEQSGTSWSTWLSYFEGYVADPSMVTVSSVVDINRNCGDNSGPGGYLDITNATGGTALDICNANWGTQMTNIAQGIAAGSRTYKLGQNALAGTIEVRVNGIPTTDFVYDGIENAVTINSPAIGEGDIVDVDYAIAADCS